MICERNVLGVTLISVEPHWNLKRASNGHGENNLLISVEPHWNLKVLSIEKIVLIGRISVEPHWNLKYSVSSVSRL